MVEHDGGPASAGAGAADAGPAKAPREQGAFFHSLFEYSPFTTVVVDREGRIVEFNEAKKRSGDRLPRVGEVMYRDYASKHEIDMHAELLACMRQGATKRFPEMRYRDRTLSITIAPFPDGALVVSQDVTEAKRAEREMVALIAQLHQALKEIETLRRLLPICASCKRIREDGGYWSSVEEYFGKCSNVNFSHTLCPECAEKLYPGLYEPADEPRAT